MGWKCKVPNSQLAWICMDYQYSRFSFLDLLLIVFYLLFLETWKVKDEESTTINLGSKISKSLDMNFISIKKHETKFCKFLYFRARESLSPINIPIPTPASDRGGPVAWVSGLALRPGGQARPRQANLEKTKKSSGKPWALVEMEAMWQRPGARPYFENLWKPVGNHANLLMSMEI